MRLHLFEWHDQEWLPAVLRDAMTSYLATVYQITPLPKLWAGRLSALMNTDGPTEIVDIGSGSGGPVERVVKELGALGLTACVTLTDLRPNKGRLQVRLDGASSVRYWPEPVDATRVPGELSGIRTMFASFHHFIPEVAQSILRDAFIKRRPICVFEATARTPAAICSALMIPLLVLLITPFVRPMSLIQVVFTYIVPILPLLIFWDGFVSHLRTYSVEEMRRFTQALQSDGYHWDCGVTQISRLAASVPYLIGQPIEVAKGALPEC